MGRPARNSGGTRGHGYLPLAGQRFDWNCHTISDKTLTELVSQSIQGANYEKKVPKEKLETKQVIRKCDSPTKRKIYKKSDFQSKELKSTNSQPKIQKLMVSTKDANVNSQVPITSSLNIKQVKDSAQPTQKAQVQSKFIQPNDFISSTYDHNNKSTAQQCPVSVQNQQKSSNSAYQLQSAGIGNNHPTSPNKLNYKRFENNEAVVAKNEQPSLSVYSSNLLIYPFTFSYIIFKPSILQPIYQTYNVNTYNQQLPIYIHFHKIKGQDLSPVLPPSMPIWKVYPPQPKQQPLEVIEYTLDTQRKKDESD